MAKYIAVDLGASNGRVIVGDLEQFTVVNRFPMKNEYINGIYFWDIIYIFSEIKAGIKEAVKLFPGEIRSIGIDSWGVDYALLDMHKRLLSNPCMYRDHRTDTSMEEVFSIIPKDEIYRQTGIQLVQFNTLYQLWADKKDNPGLLKAARSYLSIPDLLNFWLSGTIKNEYTHATTTQLYNPVQKRWTWEILEKLDLPKNIFQEVIPPGTVLGPLKEDIHSELGITQEKQIMVLAVGSHDTASAVAAVPVTGGEENLFLSSGTWSLLGVESEKPVINKQTMEASFTNEGTVSGKIRLLKNIMGMWILQESKKWWDEHEKQYSWEELSAMAEAAGPVPWQIHPNDPIFFHPSSKADPMPERIRMQCRANGEPVPGSTGEMVRGIFQGLARTYAETIKTLETITGKTYQTLYLVGGGSQENLLCRLTAVETGKTVSAGPVEATALGNILIQELAAGEISTITEGRDIIHRSQKITIYSPA